MSGAYQITSRHILIPGGQPTSLRTKVRIQNKVNKFTTQNKGRIQNKGHKIQFRTPNTEYRAKVRILIKGHKFTNQNKGQN